ncbi:MAG: flippase-like domain-containing protein [bacterium]
MPTMAPDQPGAQDPQGRSHFRIAFSLVVLCLAALFVFLNRSEIPTMLRGARDARPFFLALALGLSVAYLAAYGGLLRASLRAIGFHLGWRRALLLGPAVHFSNMSLVNSGGLGGMPLVVAEARRSKQEVSSAVLGYLVAAELGHLVFAVVLGVALASAAAVGQLTRLELVAAGVFLLYTIASVTVMATAVRNERVFFLLHGLPGRVRRWLLQKVRRTSEPAPINEPRELYEAIGALAKRPRAFVAPLLFAFLIEFIGVGTLWATLRAFGVSAGLTTPLLAYAAGVLFSTVGFLPAGLGFAEAGLGIALTQAGVDGPTTALVVVVYRLFEAWIPFATGAVTIHALSAGEPRGSPAVAAPGLAGKLRRKLAAASTLFLGVTNIFLAAVRHPLIRLGPIHERIPHVAVQSSRYVLLAAGVALIASAPGLLHGKRQAWLISVVAIVAALAAHPFKRIDFVGIGLNAGALVLLVSLVSSFPARSDPLRARQGLAWLILGELGVLVYGVLGLYLLDRHFAGQTTFVDSLEDGIRLLFVLPTTTIEPATRHGAWFIDSVRLSAIVIFLVGAYHLLHPVIHRAGGARDERRRVEALLEHYATTSIAYFHLLPDKSYFFARGGEAFIGYRVVGHTAVALGEAVGEPAARKHVVREFAEFCDLNGWNFCFHQVTEAAAMEMQHEGLQALKIGEEAIVPVQEFELSGKSFKHLRNTVNRFERDGFTFEMVASPPSELVLSELETISAQWLADGGHRERAFSVGMFTRAYLRACDVGIVRAPNGRIEAFANVIPAYNSTLGNFDLMRRRPDSADGAMDFLFVSLIGYFKDRGLSGMNLGLAPLSNIDGTGLVPAALRLMYQRGGRAFNFHGLRSFKEKWKPIWEPRYLVYRSDIQLPAVALAVARAGERSGRLPIRPKRTVPAASPTESASAT